MTKIVTERLKAIRVETERQRWEEDVVASVNESHSQTSTDGGVLISLTNKTGAASVKGTVVQASSTADLAFEAAPTTGYTAIGVVYDDGVADGEDCRIVVSGVADVLLEDSTASTRGNWVKVSATTAGRADASGTIPSPPTDANHFTEIGHCLESKSAGTDVLCKVVLHFN